MIIGLSGKKQSGKSTAANFIKAYHLLELGILESIHVQDNGLLSFFGDSSDEIAMNNTKFNENTYAEIVSFADPLKIFCINVLGLSYEHCYGSDEQKDSLTKYKVKDLPISPIKEKLPKLNPYYYRDQLGHLEQLLTARQIMQYFGTHIFRQMYPDIWVDGCINYIKSQMTEYPKLFLIADCRFPSEVNAIEKNGGIVIRFTRNQNSTDLHESEIALDHYNFTYVIDNKHMTIHEKNKALIELLSELKVLELCSVHT